MEPGRSAAQLIAKSEGLLLDFDGPVCDVYAGSDPARIAREVAAVLGLDIETDDPLELIKYAAKADGPVDEIHRKLTETEVEAVATATETPGIRELVGPYRGPIAIVSNNAAEAIDRWLTDNRLRPAVSAIIGRDPRHMKPAPQPLHHATEAISIRPSRCIFIGDSLSDIYAGQHAGVPVIALANRPYKAATFADQNCAAVVTDMTGLASN